MKSVDRRLHEPSIRGRRLGHFLNRFGTDPEAFSVTLENVLSETQYKIIASVIRKDEYKALFGRGRIDHFLPRAQYHIALDFILERFVHFLYHEANDARGVVIAERIGPKEGAELIKEYTRLQLEGTQYISPSWFRYQLNETLYFGDKDDLFAGLEMTDIIARPIAEKVLKPSETPVRWEAIKGKFYDGGQGRPESYGLKVFPTSVDKTLFE